MKLKIISLFLLMVLAFACNSNKTRLDIDVSDVRIEELEINRYEKALFSINPDSLKEGLQNIDPRYEVFLGPDWDQARNLIQLKDYILDPKIQELYRDVMSLYPGLSDLSSELSEAFRHYKYYYPGEDIPAVYSYVSGLHYEQPVEYASNILVIGLDNYLGKDYPAYKKLGIPLYKARLMSPEYISIDCFRELGIMHTPAYKTRYLLDEMILHGKFLYFIDAMLPAKAGHLKIGYTPEEIQWCRSNEASIWAFLIENELLYSKDFQAVKKFIGDGPFTAGFGNDSPGRLGVWVGWQIVRKYMEKNPGVNLQQMLGNTDAQEILQSSSYKPVKQGR
ncbi:MAG: hypothetical protein U5Q03_19090 [Bacteroidota bacterium]|nr:hypothetical protein [Bacteroidota bacterium]